MGHMTLKRHTASEAATGGWARYLHWLHWSHLSETTDTYLMHRHLHVNPETTYSHTDSYPSPSLALFSHFRAISEGWCVAAAEARRGSCWSCVISARRFRYPRCILDTCAWQWSQHIMCVPDSACVLYASNGIALTSVEDKKTSIALLRLVQTIIKQMLNFVCVS